MIESIVSIGVAYMILLCLYRGVLVFSTLGGIVA